MFSGTIKKKKKKRSCCFSSVCYWCVICSVFSFFFILWSTLHWKSFPDTWHSLGICFHCSSAGWLLCRKELRDWGLRYHPRNPVDHLLHTLSFLHSPCLPSLPGTMPSKEKRHRKHRFQDLVDLKIPLLCSMNSVVGFSLRAEALAASSSLPRYCWRPADVLRPVLGTWPSLCLTFPPLLFLLSDLLSFSYYYFPHFVIFLSLPRIF